ncbi:MAG: hypothetical protein JNM29_05545 [Candidatus Odyssella sp.]|nr:hypothetical protein [Candidatus Odyssella sp.]
MTNKFEARFRELLRIRTADSRFDTKLWRFMSGLTRNLRNLSDSELDERWKSIVKNILYVMGPARDHHPIDAGSFSSWWWLMALTQTECEFQTRSRGTPAVPEVSDLPLLRPEFATTNAIAQKHWARVSSQTWLKGTLEQGNVRFGPASDFNASKMNAAQKDLELEKSRKRPGQAVRITRQDGREMPVMGDVTFTVHSGRVADDHVEPVEYWLSSWSTEFDPRLCSDFGADAAIVIWDPEEFGERIARSADQHLPGWTFADIPVHYFDPYELQSSQKGRLPASAIKDFTFGYQRELRLALMEPNKPIPKGKPIMLQVGSIEDIAGLYRADGMKLGGTGPISFLQD